MSRNPATIAWIVLVLSFFTFCVIAFGAPMSIKWYLTQALRTDAARLEVIGGTATLQQRRSTQETAATGTTAIGEGDTIRTPGNAQAMLWLPGGSNLRLWPGTVLHVDQLRSSKYNNDNSIIHLLQDSGHSRVEVAMLSSRTRSFRIATPQGSVTLREGSYSLDLQPDHTEVVNHFGSATINAANQSVELVQQERSIVSAGTAPQQPVPAAKNLVANGDFLKGLGGWQGGDREEEEPVPGVVSPVLADGISAAHFLRAEATKHAETFLVQNVNQDVTDFRSLKLGLDLKLAQQTLSGGGWVGSEYPLMVRVKYRDVWGSEATFRRGFYFQNNDHLPTPNGEQVDSGVWLKKDAFDLFDRAMVDPPPAYIISVELAASGWSYESLVTNVRLIAE